MQIAIPGIGPHARMIKVRPIPERASGARIYHHLIAVVEKTALKTQRIGHQQAICLLQNPIENHIVLLAAPAIGTRNGLPAENREMMRILDPMPARSRNVLAVLGGEPGVALADQALIGAKQADRIAPVHPKNQPPIGRDDPHEAEADKLKVFLRNRWCLMLVVPVENESDAGDKPVIQWFGRGINH